MAVARRSDWYISLVRRSLLKEFYGGQCSDMENMLRQKADRKLGVQTSFKKELIREYGLRREQTSPKSPIWNVATGAWEPYPDYRASLAPAHIVPQAFGKRLLRHMFGDKHHYDHLWGWRNGLMLPRDLAEAMDEWAVTIVPDIPDEPTPEQRRNWATSGVKEYKFRVLDPAHELLQTRVTTVEGDMRTGADLDQCRLHFREDVELRPCTSYLYFWHCCSVLDQSLRLFQDAARSKAPEKMGLGPFWRRVFADAANVEVMDWRMNPAYLEEAIAAAVCRKEPKDQKVGS